MRLQASRNLRHIRDQTCRHLSCLFTELPFLERFAAAAKAGFARVEISFAYDVRLRTSLRLRDNG